MSDLNNTTENAGFPQALTEVQHPGVKISRRGWNSANQFVYFVPAASYPAQTRIAAETFSEGDSVPEDYQKVSVPYGAYLAIKTVQNTVVPWLASQTDLLAKDWIIERLEK